MVFRNYCVQWLTGCSNQTSADDYDIASDDEDDDEKDKEGKKTLKERLQAIQEVSHFIQNAVGWVDSCGEGVKK